MALSIQPYTVPEDDAEPLEKSSTTNVPLESEPVTVSKSQCNAKESYFGICVPLKFVVNIVEFLNDPLAAP